MNTVRLKSFCALLFGCVCIFAFSARGNANTILNNSGTGVVQTASANVTIGYDFTVGSSTIQLTALGLWDAGQNGFADPHFIGLWDNSGNLLAKGFISAVTVDPLVGEFRYTTIIPIGAGPVILSANTTYVLGAQFAANSTDAFKLNDSSHQATFDPAVSSGNARNANAFTFPNGNLRPGSLVGPNAQFTNLNGVPETGPGLLLLLSIFLAALCFSHRRLARMR